MASLKRLLLQLPILGSFALSACHKKAETRPVEPAKLAAVFRQADRIVVSDDPSAESKILYSSTNLVDIAAFQEATAITVPEEWFHCMCVGGPAIRLFRGTNELVLITGHHGLAIRTSLWSSDAQLQDSEKWLIWFDARNLPEPRREFEAMAAREKAAAVAHARWLAAMPKSLSPHWSQAMESGDGISADIKTLRPALLKEYPDPLQRALVLFTWYGSGAGGWSGYPAYESAAEELLLEISTADLIVAAETNKLTETQLEGAARLFSGSDFSEKINRERKTLSPNLKQRLLQHVIKSSDTDKKERAQGALAEP